MATRKMKKIKTWFFIFLSRLVLSKGRIRSIVAPVVPIKLARMAPRPRKIGIDDRGRLEISLQVNAAGDGEQGHEKNDKAVVVIQNFRQNFHPQGPHPDEVRQDGQGAERAHHALVQVRFPPVSVDERNQGDGQQDDDERSDRPVGEQLAQLFLNVMPWLQGNGSPWRVRAAEPERRRSWIPRRRWPESSDARAEEKQKNRISRRMVKPAGFQQVIFSIPFCQGVIDFLYPKQGTSDKGFLSSRASYGPRRCE